MTSRQTVPYFLPFVFVLSSCFLKQEPPNGPGEPVSRPYYKGVVSLEERSGELVGADIIAEFRQSEIPKREMVVSDAVDRVRLFEPNLFPKVATTREPGCAFGVGEAQDFARGDRISVGRIGFGPADQSSLVEIPQDSQHRYGLKLQSGVPTGHYEVMAEGTSDYAKFTGLMSIPEPLTEVMLQEGLVKKGDMVTFHRSKDAIIRWKAPMFENSANQILIRIDARSEGKIYRLECSGLEKELSPHRGGLAIGSQIMQKLPVTDEMVVSVMRGHLAGIQSSRLMVYFEGLRTFLARAEMKE